MASVTFDISEKWKARLASFSRWLPAIIELSLLAPKTPAAEAVSAVIEFLVGNPSPEAVHAYRLAKASELRVATLLEQNRETGLDEREAQELDEYLELEQALRKIKAELTLVGHV